MPSWSWSWSALGAVLLLVLGLTNLVLAVTGVRQDRWWVSALTGVLVVILGLRWLRDLGNRDATTNRR